MIRLGLAESFYEARRADAARVDRRALNPRDEAFAEWASLHAPVAGVPVTQDTAKSIAAYWNGVCVISGDIGAMDRHLMRRVGDGDDRERAVTHPVYRLLHEQPNADTTAMVFWETFVSHVVSWGNGYAEIEFDKALRPIGLHLITPNLIEPKVERLVDRRGRQSQRVWYLYKGQTRLDADDVLHVPGLGFDGIRGYSPVYLARQSLGLAIAQERFGAAFYGNGTQLGMVVEHPNELSPQARANIRRDLEALHAGPDMAFRLHILEEGMKLGKPVTIPPEDAQFLEGRQFTIEEIARWLNIPPHKLKHRMGERPGGNLESAEIDYQTTTLLPITKRIDQECKRKLVTPAQRDSYYVEHNFAARLKPDTETRTGAYRAYYDMGVLDAEQIARMENLPRPKPKATPAQAPVSPPPEPASEEKPLARVDPRMDTARRTLLLSVVGRFMRREAENARRAAERGAEAFGKWAEKFYAEGEEGVLRESLEPALALCLVSAGAEEDPAGVAARFARGYLDRSRVELQALPHRTIAAGVPALLKRWESVRAVEAVEELIAACGAAEEKEHVA